ncbi:unnamed protein product [Timema podura]|uniref:Uncharacterized protein n=1 Tax=Timema podura TaxID=61482 RepID=A0ABN7P3A8_TIMPD|nr:unnamed protein product [Timema podura]
MAEDSGNEDSWLYGDSNPEAQENEITNKSLNTEIAEDGDLVNGDVPNTEDTQDQHRTEATTGPQTTLSDGSRWKWQWLVEGGLSIRTTLLKREMMYLVSKHKHKFEKYKVDEMAKAVARQVIRLPLYYCELNPLEMYIIPEPEAISAPEQQEEDAAVAADADEDEDEDDEQSRLHIATGQSETESDGIINNPHCNYKAQMTDFVYTSHCSGITAWSHEGGTFHFMALKEGSANGAQLGKVYF